MNQKTIFRLLISFAAGFISFLLCHQGILALLHSIGFTSFAPFSLTPTRPLGIPRFWSLAFWGRVWGVGLSLFAFRLHSNLRDWIILLLFSALAPTAVALFIVTPLRGEAFAGGWQPKLIMTGLLVNSVWGLGTALLLRFAPRSLRKLP
jgi:hypothetical protein